MRVKINLLVWYILKTVNPLFWEGVSTSWDRVGQSGLVGVNHATISEIGDFRTGSLWLDLLICYLSLCLAIENKANQNTGKSLILDGINCLLCHAATDPFRLQIFITSIVPIMRCAYWPLISIMQDFWVVSGAIIGVGDRKRAPFQVLGLSPWYGTIILFLEQIAPSPVAHARTCCEDFCGHRAGEMASEIPEMFRISFCPTTQRVYVCWNFA